MDCLICFCPIEGQGISCGDPSCSAQSCLECTTLLMNFSYEEKIMPTCPSAECNAIILLREIKRLPHSMLAIYNELAQIHILNDKRDQALKQLEHKVILERLRDERRIFLEKEFPKAIAKVAEIALRQKLRRLERNKIKYVSDELSKSHRHCMNLYCKGFLNPEMLCMTCQTQFCPKCEREVEPEHVCRQEDIESLGYIRDISSCPKCQIPIEKSEGCNSMTCANCGTHFDYRTSVVGGGGNHGKNVPISIRNSEALSTTFASILNPEEREILLRIEAICPGSHNHDSQLTTLAKSIIRSNGSVSSKCARELERIERLRYRQREWGRAIAGIETLLKRNELSISDLEQTLTRLQAI